MDSAVALPPDSRWPGSGEHLGVRMRHRVVVTGMGVVSPIGCTLGEFRENLLLGASGAGPITRFDPAELPTRIAAEVKTAMPGPLRDTKIDFALEAARQGTRNAGLRTSREGAGLSLGLGLELFSMPDLVASRQPGSRPPDSAWDRLTFLQTPSDLCVAMICHEHRLMKPPMTHTSACAAGTDAIGYAF